MEIQAVLFDNKIWTAPEARRWLKTHNLKPLKRVDKTERYLRYRITKPNPKSKYATKTTDKGVTFVLKS